MFQAAVNLSNISEFSLIILLVGLQMGLVSSASLTVIAVSLIVSTIISSLMIAKSGYLYKYIRSFVNFFERKNYRHFSDKLESQELLDHVVLIGAHRVGGQVVQLLKREKAPFIVLDFNPAQVERLLKEDISVIYGDMGDPEILDSLNLGNAKMVISTSPDIADNKLLLEDLKLRGVNIPVIARAESVKQARSLYKLGADYVIIPEVLAGDVLLNLLRDHLNSKAFFKDRPRIELEKLSRKTLAWE